jgi:hypothetical protein
MDHLRKALGWLKRQHFWVLSAIVAAVALASWYRASGVLQSEFKANEGTIKGQFSAVDGVANQPFIANPTISQEQTAQIAKRREAVNQIWQQLYDRQREQVLQWPPVLSQQFRDQVEKLRFEDEIPGELRDDYMNYINRHFPELPKKIQAREMAAGDTGSGYGGGRMSAGRGMDMGEGGFGRGGEGGFGRGESSYGPPPEGELTSDQDDYLVEWRDQGLVRDQLSFPHRPTALEIWVTQEDLWVYHTLLNVIANTNQAKGADRMSNAAVRVIYSLEIGKLAAEASRATGRIFMPPTATPMGGEMGPGRDGGGGEMAPSLGGGGEMAPSLGGGGEMGLGPEGGGGEGQERMMLLLGRYLDAQGQPVQVSSPTPAPGEFGTEYKRLPIRMTLEMDLRWLPYLITECANQPLQVEVEQVRINPSGTDTGGMGGSFRGRGGSRGGFESGSGGSPFSSEGQGGEIRSFDAQPHVGTVVIQGIIYIFNPPDLPATQPSESVAATP